MLKMIKVNLSIHTQRYKSFEAKINSSEHSTISILKKIYVNFGNNEFFWFKNAFFKDKVSNVYLKMIKVNLSIHVLNDTNHMRLK